MYQKKTLVLSCVGTGIGGVLLGLILGLAINASPPTRANPQEGLKNASAEPSKATMLREEFRAAVIGKSPDQVIAAVGRPNSTSEAGYREPMWYYKDRTRDPITGKIDSMIQVIFKFGVVSSISF